MATFAVILTGSVEGTTELLEKHYPKPQHHQMHECVYLVRADAITQTVADNLGLTPPDQEPRTGEPYRSGMVFKLNASHAGFERLQVWEWLALGKDE